MGDDGQFIHQGRPVAGLGAISNGQGQHYQQCTSLVVDQSRCQLFSRHQTLPPTSVYSKLYGQAQLACMLYNGTIVSPGTHHHRHHVRATLPLAITILRIKRRDRLHALVNTDPRDCSLVHEAINLLASAQSSHLECFFSTIASLCFCTLYRFYPSYGASLRRKESVSSQCFNHFGRLPIETILS